MFIKAIFYVSSKFHKCSFNFRSSFINARPIFVQVSQTLVQFSFKFHKRSSNFRSSFINARPSFFQVTTETENALPKQQTHKYIIKSQLSVNVLKVEKASTTIYVRINCHKMMAIKQRPESLFRIYVRSVGTARLKDD